MKSLAVKIWIMILLLAVAGYAAFTIRNKRVEREEVERQQVAARKLAEEKAKVAITEVPPVPVDLDSFTMTERNGKPMSFGELRGQVWIASMFFASCPNECRLLNQTVAALHNDPLFKDVKFVSVTVDPAVDTPESLSKTADILGADPKRWLFFTGKLDDIVRLGKQAKVDAGYKNHVARLMLFDRQGRIRGYYMFDDAQQIAKLRLEVPRLLAEGLGDSGQGVGAGDKSKTSPAKP
ncbi:MAG: SCO family protein [Planctomycetes bacterium]|nr:SCO family protein [Planctomycetota bacterium]